MTGGEARRRGVRAHVGDADRAALAREQAEHAQPFGRMADAHLLLLAHAGSAELHEVPLVVERRERRVPRAADLARELDDLLQERAPGDLGRERRPRGGEEAQLVRAALQIVGHLDEARVLAGEARVQLGEPREDDHREGDHPGQADRELDQVRLAGRQEALEGEVVERDEPREQEARDDERDDPQPAEARAPRPTLAHERREGRIAPPLRGKEVVGVTMTALAWAFRRTRGSAATASRAGGGASGPGRSSRRSSTRP